MDLHYSQTSNSDNIECCPFHYLMDLHYSQTDKRRNSHLFLVSLPYGFTLFSNKVRLQYNGVYSFTTLWIYTILKHHRNRCCYTVGFTTLWIYTILKRQDRKNSADNCFTTLWIYTILKLYANSQGITAGFTTLWIYTILKPEAHPAPHCRVSLPYGFTLFSNNFILTQACRLVSLPYGFTLFSNTAP